MIDYTSCSDDELAQCLLNINRGVYPDDFNRLVAEIGRRRESKDSMATISEDSEPLPSETNGLYSDSTLEAIKGRITGRIVPKPSNSGLLVIGLVAFSLLQATKSDMTYALSLIPILFLHESGHLLAMKAFGYKNLSIFFIPFFGALTSGIPNKPSRKKASIISMAGPVAGIVFGVAAMYLNKYGYPSKFLVYFGWYSFALNLFNLLPILPFDGGRFWDALLASRHAYLSIAFKVVTICLLVAGAVQSEDWMLGLLGLFIAARIREEYIEYKADQEIRLERKADPEDLTLEEIRGVVQTFDRMTKHQNPEARLGLIVERTVSYCTNRATPPASWKYAALAVAIYLFVVFVGFLCLVGAGYRLEHLV